MTVYTILFCFSFIPVCNAAHSSDFYKRSLLLVYIRNFFTFTRKKIFNDFYWNDNRRPISKMICLTNNNMCNI